MKKLKFRRPTPSRFFYLHPFTGEADIYPFSQSPDIVNRARSLLVSIDHDELMDMLWTINGTIYKNAKKLQVMDMNPVSLLDMNVDKKTFALIHPHAKHPASDYFAVLALSLIDNSMHTLDLTRRVFLPSKQRGLMIDQATRNSMAANHIIFAMEAVSYSERLKEMAVIKQKDDVIANHSRGTKANSLASAEKWALANEYLKEEIPRHRKINDARAAAAHKAGIGVATRRLIQMMPDPRKA